MCTGSQQSTISATLSLIEVRTADYDAVIFIDGRGSQAYFTDGEAFRIAMDMSKSNKITAAICLAPVILANAGVLKNRRATVAKTEVTALEAKKTYMGPGVIADGNAITGSSPQYSKKFAKKIINTIENT